jgi:hypothetical protein
MAIITYPYEQWSVNRNQGKVSDRLLNSDHQIVKMEQPCL